MGLLFLFAVSIVLSAVATARVYRAGVFSTGQRMGLTLLAWFLPLFGPLVILALTAKPEKPSTGEAPLQSDIGMRNLYEIGKH